MDTPPPPPYQMTDPFCPPFAQGQPYPYPHMVPSCPPPPPYSPQSPTYPTAPLAPTGPAPLAPQGTQIGFQQLYPALPSAVDSVTSGPWMTCQTAGPNPSPTSPGPSSSGTSGGTMQPGDINEYLPIFSYNTFQEAPLPSGLRLCWQQEVPNIRIFFLQLEKGFVTSPKKLVPIKIYAGDGKQSDVQIMLAAPQICRLKVKRGGAPILLSSKGDLIFYDQSTDPPRHVAVSYPAEESKQRWRDLQIILQSEGSLCVEDKEFLEKMAYTVESTYSTITNKLNSVVRDSAPSIHKKTGWLRKGTGSFVRLGGTVVDKGLHVIADQISDKNSPAHLSQEHRHLLEAARLLERALHGNEVTYVSPAHLL